MANEPLDPVIEKYRMELLEFSRQNPKFTQPAEAQAETTVEVEAEAEAEMLPEERVVPPEGLYRADFPQSAAVTDRELRLRNVSAREQTIPADVKPDAARGLPQAQRGDCNEGEHAYALDADKYPPFCNGEVDKFQSREDFLKANPELGYLRVQVFAANQSYPIPNAHVEVSKQFGGDKYVFFATQTDASGVMSRISLPAPDRELSESPSALQPYATYEIAVSHPGFTPVIFRNCAVFDRIETIQYAELIPLTGADQPDTIAILEE
jgi:hypothetical protein